MFLGTLSSWPEEPLPGEGPAQRTLRDPASPECSIPRVLILVGVADELTTEWFSPPATDSALMRDILFLGQGGTFKS